jgi:hypothetical protein
VQSKAKQKKTLFVKKAKNWEKTFIRRLRTAKTISLTHHDVMSLDLHLFARKLFAFQFKAGQCGKRKEEKTENNISFPERAANDFHKFQ